MPNQPPTAPGSQALLFSGTQATSTPELLQPVAYSPLPPQTPTTNEYQQPNGDNDIITPSNPSYPPPQRAPPLPPLKLPLTDSDESLSQKKPQSIHASYSPQSESHQSKSSLDQELRQYQQYSERIHKLADSSVESLRSYRRSRAENESRAPLVDQHLTPKAETDESDQYQSSRQEQDILVREASSDGARLDPTRGGENLESTGISFPLSKPSISSGQHHPNTVHSVPNTAVSSSPVSSTINTPPNKSIQQTKLSLAQTKDHGGNVTGRKSNDSLYWHSTNSHNSSCSLSEEESQLRSADVVPPHSIITRPNPKIISIVNNQRRSEPTRNLSPMVSSPRGHHSASALGFGGPSDWEHFGDYEAEEIDDTDLYSRSKPDVVAVTAGDAAELPVDTTPTDKQQSLIKSELVEPKSNPIDPPQTSVQGIGDVECYKLDQGSATSGDENSKTPGTEPQMDAKSFDSTSPQSSQMQTEEAIPQSQSPNVDEIIKAWSEDSTKGKAPEHQPPASFHFGDREPSDDQPMKSLQGDQNEAPSSRGTSSIQKLDSPQQGQDEALSSRLSSGQLDAPLLAEEAIAVQHTPQWQTPNHVEMNPEEGEVPSLVNETSSEAEESKVSQATPNDQGKSQESSPDDPSAASKRETREKITTTAALVPLDSTTTARSSTSATLSPGGITVHESSRLKNSKPLTSNEMDDMYADLDPWGRASLHRYMSMLREEVDAKTDVEKFRIFTVFANKETKLRAVLYAADDDATIMRVSLNGDSPKDAAESLAKHSEKALPALPPDGGSLGGQTLERPEEHPASESESMIVPEQFVISSDIETPSVETQHSTEGNLILPQETKDENPTNPALELKTPRDRVNKAWTQFTNYIYPAQSSSPEVPKIVVPENAAEPRNSAYIPYKYNQTEAELTNYLSRRQSAYRPYAALTTSSLDNGSSPTTEFDNKRGSTVESFVSQIQEENHQENQPFELTTSFPEIAGLEENNQTTGKPDLRRFVKSDFDPLSSVLPSSGVIVQDSAELQELHSSIDAFPDDFGFIRQSVMTWDAVAKKEREQSERERHIRQGESERKIDELFNDDEIGYGDISGLEAEFKRSEVSRKAEEDRHEYYTFLSSVFEVVWTRLHYEIDHLTPLYDKYTTSIKGSLVGKDMFEVSTTQLTLAPLMSALLALHQKLEVRHQKAFEAVLERDRRLKKTEVSAWYTSGNVSKVKELEKQFEGAEKNAIVAYCQHRDERANKLMDVLDHNTLRGVGANQDYMECLMKAVRRVASGRAFASIPSSDPGVGVEEVKKAKSITTALSASSEQIVRTFHVADMLLNAADYELSVAKAKLTNEDTETLQRLKEERTKEDQKLVKDLEHRLALIREDTRRTHDEVTKLLVFLSIENGHPEAASTIPETLARSEPEERVQIALNDAMRMTAPKEPKV